jgi:hypothetical protein
MFLLFSYFLLLVDLFVAPYTSDTFLTLSHLFVYDVYAV